VGYSRLLEGDETGTLALLKSRRAELIDPVVRRYNGSVINVAGDAILIEFPSAVGAVEAALELQAGFEAGNAGLAEDRQVRLRIGINLGEVVGEGAETYGSGVNIAARLEQLSEPGGVAVSAKVRDEVRGKAGVAFTDLGEHALKNIAEPVRVFAASGSAGGETAAPSQNPIVKRPSIAILPFANMGGDPAQQYLADGITEDITTELSRFRGLSVAARLAAFHFAGKGLSPDAIARQLGVAFLLEGSVRKLGDRVRVTAQLIDATSGSHVWAERYDREARDIFSVQDDVVASIVTSLEGRMTTAGAASARRKATANWSAYDCLLQGRELTNEYREPEAIPYFRRAIAIDPDFALAHAWLAVALTISDLVMVEADGLTEASAASLRALALDEGDATAHYARALVERRLRAFGRAFRSGHAAQPF
jgi:adenylate cyclase